MNLRDISTGPIAKKFYELALAIEELPASNKQTRAQIIREELLILVEKELNSLNQEGTEK